MSATSPIIVGSERNREKALDLRAEGLTFQEIAEKLEISKTRAYELVKEALDEVREENNIRAVHLRDLSLRRINKIRAKLWDNRGKPDTAMALVRLEKREAELLGLDAPRKIEQSGPNGGPIRLEGGKVLLTDDERKNRLKALKLDGLLPSLLASNGNGHRDN
jgi:predicted DNA-binding protein YlxM (UPF0122 family)